jgi:hypothetical protein
VKDEPVDDDEPTQETEQGYEIPVPKRSQWDRLLGRVARGGGANGADRKKGKS